MLRIYAIFAREKDGMTTVSFDRVRGLSGAGLVHCLRPLRLRPLRLRPLPS